jgi:hydroxymethylpyrimidine pyrophosphatase-like HAD family hydrolase
VAAPFAVRVSLVAADLDGTLVGRGMPASDRVRSAIDLCRARRVPVVAVTARRWFAAETLVRELHLGPLALVAGGATIRDVVTGAVVDAVELPTELVRAAVLAISEAGLPPMIGAAGGDLQLAGPVAEDNASTADYLSRGAVERHVDLAAAAVPAARVLAMGSEREIRNAAAACAGLSAHVLVQPCIIQPPACDEPQFELHVAAADKGSGFLRLCALLGVDPARSLAVGDAPSDLPLLAAAGIGVLMGDAAPELRHEGMVIAPALADDGSAWALETLVLG